ncbi:glycosyltransferase [Arthrobacter zhaoxinii]|uniref:Glycosyltransferase n=1 Tax=Arthrobacter zhaoxinii TaxID=2964616 RepID=A0ABY5YMR3_9MICC|nr:glycosyltransferase [Arthrobacter zhaoxinii]UWX96107.1 glycosyltransferase [Arthrobacter zhaoxinii]
MEHHVYVAMFGALPDQPTGLAVSVLRRAQAFATKGITTEILVDTFTPDYDGHANRLRALGRLSDLTIVRSMYNDLAGQPQYGSSTLYVSPLGGDGWEYVQDDKRSEAWRGRENGTYRHFVWMRGEQVHFIDHMHNNQRVRREWHDVAGRVCKIELMNSENKPELIRYLDRGGFCYLEELMDSVTGKLRGIVLNQVEGTSLFFRTKVDLFRHWMQHHVLNGDASPTIISEYGLRRTALEALERENNARVIYTVHNNHFPSPYTYGEVRADMRDFFDHMHKYTDVIVLTEEQRIDIWKQYGHLESVQVIPHHMPKSTGVGPRDEKKVVVLGRFHDMKGQLDVVRAFPAVLKTVPEAKLEFYGRGPDEEKIRAEIVSLGLEKSARVVGFTNDSYQVFSEAAVSVVASDYEGFCLSLAESMASGCVPVSYDVKYGPRALIRNGVDGLLVEHGNLRELADAMTYLLNNDDRRKQMARSAMEVLSTLSESRFLDDWMQVLEDKIVKGRATQGDEVVPSEDHITESVHAG